LHLLPPRKKREGDQDRPGEREEREKHFEDKRQFQELLREHQVDLIVVCADCLEAKRLKKTLVEFANLNQQEEEGEDEVRKEAIVIWGKSEIPKLFASSL